MSCKGSYRFKVIFILSFMFFSNFACAQDTEKKENTSQKVEQRVKGFFDDLMYSMHGGVAYNLAFNKEFDDNAWDQDSGNLGYVIGASVMKPYDFNFPFLQKLAIGLGMKHIHNKLTGDVWLQGDYEAAYGTDFTVINDNYAIYFDIDGYFIKAGPAYFGLDFGVGANIYNLQLTADNRPIPDVGGHIDMVYLPKDNTSSTWYLELGPFASFVTQYVDLRLNLLYVYLGKLKSGTDSRLPPQLDLPSPFTYRGHQFYLGLTIAFGGTHQ